MWVPFWGWMWWASGCLFIDRNSRGDAVEVMKVAEDRIKEGTDSIWIFSEGTRGNPSSNFFFFLLKSESLEILKNIEISI
jgi:1-acyl-sn-glycerol-3-phosphate acyltransferase